MNFLILILLDDDELISYTIFVCQDLIFYQMKSVYFHVFLRANEVATPVRAALEHLSEICIHPTELELVDKLRSCHIADGAKEDGKVEILIQLDRLLRELNIRLTQLALANGSGVWCFSICTSESQLQQLYDRYRSGKMKSIFENVFTLLLGRTITIRELSWKFEDYEVCRKRIIKLNTAGW
jgi:hypothetical protein